MMLYMLEERFTEKFEIDRETDCWLWTAGRNGGGYGAYADLRKTDQTKNRMVPAHRYAYEQEVGPVPEGLDLDHLCRVRHCVNPDHLEPVTRGENLRRGDHNHRGKTHCKRGHEYTLDNTYRWTNPKTGLTHRICRACQSARQTPRSRRQ